MTAGSQERSVFIAEHFMLPDKRSTTILREKASPGNTKRLLNK